MRKFPTGLVFLIPLLTLLSVATAGDTLTPTQSLTDGQTLVSAGGTFALGFFSPNNSKNRYIGIWYYNIPIHTVVWIANRKNPITGTLGNLSITTNGTLVITDQHSTIIWFSATTSLTNPVAQLVDNGNLVVNEVNSSDTESFAWQSFDHPTDTMLPGGKVGSNLITGLNRNLTSWKSDDDPSPGDYCMAMDIGGDPQITLWAGSVRKWWSGPWNGIEFTGPPVTGNFSTLTFYFVDNKEEIYYTFNEHNKSTISRLVMNNSGVVQLFVWFDSTVMWNLLWIFPKDQCDGSALCGSYGICEPNSLSICSCLQGFKPKLDQERYKNDGSGGCVRKTELDCWNGTDGFTNVSGALLPDTLNAMVNMDMSLDECSGVCLSNCSCTAYASADVRGNGNGCIIWVSDLVGLEVSMDGGQDLYVRLAAADIDSIQQQSLKSKHSINVIVISVVLGTLLLASVGWYIWRKKRRRKDEESIVITEENDLDLPLFDFGTISAATNNFSNQNKLGEGGFGPVYKGMLGEEHEIAVKRQAKTSVQGLDELKTEVSLIAKLQHRNLVRLLGCCIQGEERILIYEYMHNKSLDAFLFEKKVLLDWKVRYHIIVGIARGLLYLHQDSRFRIIHRDLKPSNILLDKEMNPKISDFGMARIFGGDETESKTKRVVGTYGYMSPEYAIDGIFSVKSDVFSFGVLLLEIISGEKNKGVYLSAPHLFLLGHAWSLWEKGKSLELVDASMGHYFSKTEVMRCTKIGLLCVQECPEDRPAMSSVVLMLGSDTTLLPEPKQPGFMARRGPFEANSSSTNPSNSVNSITITMSAGR